MKNYDSNVPLKNWAKADLPREKLFMKGRHNLSDAELIAILLSTGNTGENVLDLSRKILSSVKNDLNALGKLNLNDLTKFRGIGLAKAAILIASLELGRRRTKPNTGRKDRIRSSKEAFNYISPLVSDLPHEEFWLILLNRANFVIACNSISKGGVTATIVDTKMIFKYALENLAVSVILCHNHPSGNKEPSPADIALTEKIVETGKLMEINIIDHLIIAEGDYFSFADENLL